MRAPATLTFEPIAPLERHANLDLIRGAALAGVLFINLMYFFRVSLFEHMIKFHTHPGRVNHAIDLLVATLFEFKAFDLFSLCFGIGVAVQTERALSRNISATAFLIRRFSILLAFGVLHMVLISNVDILVLYAVCGMALIPMLRLRVPLLVIAGLTFAFTPSVPLNGLDRLPPESMWPQHAELATRIYSQGSFAEAVVFRARETRDYILPLLAMSAQKTFGLMLIGVALWRGGVVQAPQRHRRWLLLVGWGAGLIGLFNTIADVTSRATGRPSDAPVLLELFGSHVPLAFSYGALLLACSCAVRPSSVTALFIAAGRMALSNYLGQSIAFALIFYGYGLRLFGKLDPTSASILGLAFYGIQLGFSVWWLKRYRFGPFEWLWRSITYGRSQPMRHFPPQA